jgi:hypothetical protein
MLSKKAIEALKASESMKGRIAEALGRSVYTVNRWMYDNDVMLTTATALQIIREETGLTDDEILQKESAA